LSPRNAEVVRALVAHWNSGDRDLALVSEYLDPAVELESPFSSVIGEPYRGYAGIEQWMRDLDEQFAEWAIGVDETRVVGDKVIATATVRARGRASGAPLEFDAAAICDLASDHRVTRIHIYLDVQEALRAVAPEG
jgi:hypothetical protein